MRLNIVDPLRDAMIGKGETDYKALLDKFAPVGDGLEKVVQMLDAQYLASEAIPLHQRKRMINR